MEGCQFSYTSPAPENKVTSRVKDEYNRRRRNQKKTKKIKENPQFLDPMIGIVAELWSSGGSGLVECTWTSWKISFCAISSPTFPSRIWDGVPSYARGGTGIKQALNTFTFINSNLLVNFLLVPRILNDEDNDVWRLHCIRKLAEEVLNSDLLSSVPTYKAKLKAFYHAWNPDDCSRNIYVKPNGFTIHRNPVAQSTDGVRGKIGKKLHHFPC